MARYGLPYKGSKSQIADDILSFLPSGERLVDLFGGGGAITHCACEHYLDGLTPKWNGVLYNEINPIVVDFFERAITVNIILNALRPIG